MAAGILIKEKSSSGVKTSYLYLQASIFQTEDGKSWFYLGFLW